MNSSVSHRSLIALGLCVAASYAHAQEIVPLYAGAIPNAIDAPDEESTRDPKEPYLFRQNISRPTLTIYLPQRRDAKHAAVIILPGGSYRGLSIVKEGHDVAREFNAMGVAAFVLKYRTPSERTMQDRTRGPLQDAQQALRVVRERAAEWQIDPARVGLVGFSAGGHLASTAATHFTTPVAGGTATVRPDFLVLLYPVISFDAAITHKVSREMLIGATPTREQIELYSNERQVTAQTPPTFIVHAADDSGVPVANSLRFFEAVHAQGIPAELIVYPAGGHGFGLNNATTKDRWIDRCRDWLASEGWLAGDAK
jgi:acetyl esterase/lipase